MIKFNVPVKEYLSRANRRYKVLARYSLYGKKRHATHIHEMDLEKVNVFDNIIYLINNPISILK